MNWSRPGFDFVLEFFEGDIAKAHRWYFVPNPHFGTTPHLLIQMGQGDRILKMVRDAAASNMRGMMHAAP